MCTIREFVSADIKSEKKAGEASQRPDLSHDALPRLGS